MKPLLRTILLLIAVAPAAQARVDANETALAALAPSVISRSAVVASQLADQVNAVLVMRAQMTDRAAPQPAVGCTNPNEIARRLEALKALDAFTRVTINGLIDAAPSSELKAAASEDLTPLLIRHRQELSATLLDLLELPLVRGTESLAADIVRLADQAARP